MAGGVDEMVASYQWAGDQWNYYHHDARGHVIMLTDAAGAFLRARDRAAVPVAARPDDAKALIVLAKVDAKLGRKEEAVRAAERAVELLPVAVDAYDGGLMLVRLAQVYAQVGDRDRAIEVLQRAAALPAGPAYGILQLDAEFDSLRDDARFQKIVASLAPTRNR